MLKSKIALIYGGVGQNGYLLSKFLLKKKYKIYSIIKKKNKDRFDKRIIYLKINIQNYKSAYALIKKIKPDEIYNFLGPSDKNLFEKSANYYFEKDFLCNLNTLEIVRQLGLKTKIFYSSSSEVFGLKKRIVKEDSPRLITNNYALTKNMNETLINYYREFYNINACYGILFNHDSEFRKDKFMYKILYNYFKIKNFSSPLKINNINDKKFRSNAYILVKVIWKILNNKVISDYIISSDKVYSIKKLVNYFAKKNQINLKWIKQGNKIYGLNKKKIIISSFDKKNTYFLKPNLKKLKNEIDIDLKNLRLF